ncbi:hypothetical protein HanIR_Chr04g0206251 [Helianthus annuus]|nr:hypothetical protein HanIR_Chr04g0206251 [Helianthus annuus]
MFTLCNMTSQGLVPYLRPFPFYSQTKNTTSSLLSSHSSTIVPSLKISHPPSSLCSMQRGIPSFFQRQPLNVESSSSSSKPLKIDMDNLPWNPSERFDIYVSCF